MTMNSTMELERVESVPQTLALSLDRAQAVARELRRYVAEVGLTVRIGPSEYVRIEGWQFLCHLCQLPLPTIVGVRREDRDGGYAYVAEAVLEYGGREYRAFAMCSSDEPNWRGKPEYSIMSMAQTRACGKVLRLLLGWILPIAGYAATPAEEMVDEQQNPPPPNADNTTLRALRRTNQSQYRRIVASLRQRIEQTFVDDADFTQYLQQHYNARTLDELTLAQARALYQSLAQADEGGEGGGQRAD